MSPFSSVDGSPDPSALVAYLGATAFGLAAMKDYMTAAARQAVPAGLVVDLGCGAGHDAALLAGGGLRPVGVDPSVTMLAAAADRLRALALPTRLVQADGHRLPFRTGSVDGCRIERVLQHVDDPDGVMAEVARVLRPGGHLTVFEPDWASLGFGARDPDDRAVARAVVAVRRPDVGGRLDRLVAAHGLRIVDRVTEQSFAYGISAHPLRLDRALERAVGDGRLDGAVAARWWARQNALDVAGRFQATWAKVLVVAERPRRPAADAKRRSRRARQHGGHA
ncbi:MAG TPA: methyltransferase domain-containing protein [Acidimicrobiales bacterium]